MTFQIPDSMKNGDCAGTESTDVSGFTIDVTSVVYPLSVTSIKKDTVVKGTGGSVADVYGLVEWLNKATGERWDTQGALIDKQTVFTKSTHTYDTFVNGQNLTVVASA